MACMSLFAVTSALAVDKEIPLAELPKPVTDAIMKAHPDAKMVSAQRDTKVDGAVQNYEVKVMKGTDEMEIKVSPEGVITTKDD